MKLVLCVTLLALAAAGQSQTGTQDVAPLAVVKFSCGKYEQRSSVIRSVQDPDPPKNEPIRINQTNRNEPQEVINRRDMAERRAELRTAEINAELSTQPGLKIYFYHLEVKNIGTRPIKSFAWEYQPDSSPDPSDRQFFCVVKAKPNDKKGFDLFTPLAPSRVVDAATVNDKTAKKSNGLVVINKIEYADGSVWVRSGWNPATFSAEATQKVATGKCVGF